MRFFMLTLEGGTVLGMVSGQIAFSMDEANMRARLAQLSYCDPSNSPDVLDWTCQTCIDSKVDVVPGSVRFVHEPDDRHNKSQAITGRLRGQSGCFIAFRGTHSWRNWLTDLNTWYYNSSFASYNHCDGCKVHSGFYGTWKALKNGVQAALDEAGCKASGHPIYLAGHSLGGAVAHLAAFTLKKKGYKVGSMYSFEAPRVGNDKFAATFNSIFGDNEACYRITHDHDPVVHVPPQWLGFTHVNTEVYFHATGSTYGVCAETEDPKCSNQNSDLIVDLTYASQHCGLPAFGDGFNICGPVCSAPKFASVMV